MSAGLSSIDSVAWRSSWSYRPVGEKTVLFGGLLIVVVTVQSWQASLIASAVCIVAAQRAHVRLRHLQQCLCAPLVFVSVAAVTTAVSVDFSAPRVFISVEAASDAAELALRALSASLVTLTFASCTPIMSLTAALQRARVPAACIDVVIVMYRITFVLLDSLRTIRQAQINRMGYSTALRGIRSAALLTAAVFTQSLDRARRLDSGLQGRDLRGKTPSIRVHASSRTFIYVSIATVALSAMTAGVLS